MAAEDFTGPPVLKLQIRAIFVARLSLATPVRAGPPWNIGHSAAEEIVAANQNQRTVRKLAQARLQTAAATGSRDQHRLPRGGHLMHVRSGDLSMESCT